MTRIRRTAPARALVAGALLLSLMVAPMASANTLHRQSGGPTVATIAQLRANSATYNGQLVEVKNASIFALMTVNNWYVYDGTGGMNVYLNLGLPGLKLGQVEQVTGYFSQYNGEWEINPRAGSDVLLVKKKGGKQPTPIMTTANNAFLYSNPGVLVTVPNGLVMYANSFSGFTISDTTTLTKALSIYVNYQTPVDLTNIAAGQHLTVTGVEVNYKGIGELLPRTNADIVTN